MRHSPTNDTCAGSAGVARRAFLSDLGMGFTGLVMGAMLAKEGVVQGSPAASQHTAGTPEFVPAAKSVIWLFMNGGISHLESFDPKPEVTRYAGKTIHETPYADTQDPKWFANRREVAFNVELRQTLYPLQIGYRKYGESGIELSDWLPNIGRCIDDIAVVRSMWTTDDNHGAQGQFHSGRHTLDGNFPTLGAWVHWGLGTLNENLPQFISIGQRPPWNATDGHYLGPAHDSVPIRIKPDDPLDFATNAGHLSPGEQQLGFELAGRLNQLRAIEYPDDAALRARIKAYELAYHMQTSIPETLSIGDETQTTQDLYGLNDPATRSFGTQLLAVRRLVERGVRFVQLQYGGGGAGAWDAHARLKPNHERNFKAVDGPVAGLLTDLKQRGLLDSTIVLFATEFGRTPGSQGSDGRDHHPYGFSVWMAGGGIKGGIVHGATDEIGFHAVEKPHYVTDIHATILHQLGLDAHKLVVPGRKRLAIEFGEPIHQIIS